MINNLTLHDFKINRYEDQYSLLSEYKVEYKNLCIISTGDPYMKMKYGDLNKLKQCELEINDTIEGNGRDVSYRIIKRINEIEKEI
jgi:hypothetical protein